MSGAAERRAIADIILSRLASQKSKRSRKRRNPSAGPRAVPSTRREERAERQAAAQRQLRRESRPLGRDGERPTSPFGGLPVSEFAIFLGFIGIIIGFINHGGPALIVGIVVCAFGVVEITGREHFSGYRSHTILLAAIPAIGLEVALVAVFGEPKERGLLLVAVVPVFGILFWLLRRKFQVARQARLARPPMP
ncbi:MAG: hypothetical protein WAK93_15050 [Solirubrobacteraceae bacterium]